MTGTKNDWVNYRIARAKDTYDDLFDFHKNNVEPYFESVNDFISMIDSMIQK